MPASAEERAEASLEYAVKAAFLYNFAHFVEWPSEPAAPSPFVIGLLGEDPFGAALDKAVEGKTVRGRSLVVRRFAKLEDLAPCPILFVGASEAPRLSLVLARLRGSPVLVVGDADGFAREGGTVGFFIEDNRVRFEINLNAAGAAGLKVSSRLLAVARVVPSKPGSPE